MAGEGVYYVGPDSKLTAMVATAYSAEDVLQELLATHPDVMSGGARG